MTDTLRSGHLSAEKIASLLHEAENEYKHTNPNSQNLHERAIIVLPGGNTRSVLHTDPFPIYMDRGEGNRLMDVDGHEYLDLVGEMTASVCGHSNPVIRDAIISTITNTGLNLGASTAAEVRFAEQVQSRFPSMERMRFCNSGTEANIYALSIARQATGRSKIIVFNGAYHGGVLTFVHGVSVNSVDRDDWIVGTYNDEEGVQQLISENKGIAAAVLVEGMQGAGGCIPGSAKFMHAIQKATKENGMIFIVDEVMTSRLAPGGLQSTILDPHDGAPLKPDITTLGKYIAGGMTIGAFGGRKELLSMYDPRPASELAMQGKPAQMSHSGTFNNNTLAMHVGTVALSAVYTPAVCTELNALGDWFRQELLERCQGSRMTVTGVGSVCNIHFGAHEDQREILRIEHLDERHSKADSDLRDLFWFQAVQKGFWIARRGLMTLTMGTSRSELQGFIEFVEDFVRSTRGLRC
ncbi:glutamate-1-semialdehyde 2-1-aminomutase [Penicillium sp. IBT 18751x]|nr:glutamate-1-semialdehyde 2-1-aminomutase [Penicillium sp. IBT 18751x]